MAWTVETRSETVDEEVAALPPKIQATPPWIMERIEERGLPALRSPHVGHLGEGMYDLRAKGQEGIGRALFVIRGTRVIVLHAFQKKTQKIPARAIDLAWKREKSVT